MKLLLKLLPWEILKLKNPKRVEQRKEKKRLMINLVKGEISFPRFEFSRNRNREHAKNTRLRKKAFLTKLTELCEKLTAQRNKEIEDRLALGKRIHETVVFLTPSFHSIALASPS
jgi:hypothetical protein